MGMALVPFAAFMNSASGPVINFYPAGNASLKTPSGGDVMLDLSTGYPKTGAVAITVTPKKQESFSLRLRIPSWSRNTALKINGKEQAVTSGTYAEIKRAWSAGDKVELVLDMRCRLIHAPRGSDRAGDHFQALIRGPIILARDVRLGEDIRQALDVQADPQGYVAVSAVAPTTDAGMEFVVPVAGGGSFHAVDYASAGNTWDARSEYRTWIPTAGAVR